ncbi:MAG: hypothetical protein M0013_06145 [Actinomycetota bacterium]|nr:hypothetical protein [Actinomycetota bacterium]
MEITAAILCDFAEIREGLLFVMAGGVMRVVRPNLPGPLGLMVAGTAEIRPDQFDQIHSVTVIMKDPDAATDLARVTTALQPHRPPGLKEGEPLVVPFVVRIGAVMLHHHGAYDVHVGSDDEKPRVLSCYVVPARSTS